MNRMKAGTLSRSNPISIIFLIAASKLSPVRRSFESEECEVAGGAGASEGGGAAEGAVEGADAEAPGFSGVVAQVSD